MFPAARQTNKRLVRLVDQIVQAMPGSSLAAYVTFREMQAENASRRFFSSRASSNWSSTVNPRRIEPSAPACGANVAIPSAIVPAAT
jgi:hypothetical protein